MPATPSFGQSTPVTSRALNTTFATLLSGGYDFANIIATGNITSSAKIGWSASTYLLPVQGGATQYGSVQVTGTPTSSGWSGYSINGDAVFMSTSTSLGLYDNTNLEWSLLYTRNAQTDIYYNGAIKLSTSNTGATTTGTHTATAFSGDGSSLTALPAGQLTGTIASARISGAYTGFTSITVDGASSPAMTLGDWSGTVTFASIATSYGYLLLGGGNNNVYLRANAAAGVVSLGGNQSDTLLVGNSDSTFAGTLNGNGIWNNTSDTKAANLWITSYLIANTGVTSSGQSAQWITAFGLWYLVRNSSTRNDKENVQSLNGIVSPNMIDDIDILLWSRKNAAGIPEIGPMAEDMDAVSPFLSTRGIDYDDKGNVVQTEPNGININSWLSLLTLSVQDIRKRLQQLETV